MIYSLDIFPTVDVNRSYAFDYPDFQDPTITRHHRLFVRWVRQWHGDWLITGEDLEARAERSFYYREMTGIEPLVKPVDPLPTYRAGRLRDRMTAFLMVVCMAACAISNKPESVPAPVAITVESDGAK
jgi:hypothetical protein